MALTDELLGLCVLPANIAYPSKPKQRHSAFVIAHASFANELSSSTLMSFAGLTQFT
jgi:hypothetical protein